MFSSQEFEKRRARCLQQLEAPCLAILVGNSLQVRNGDAEYAFRQHSDFYYLTGMQEPDMIMLLIKEETTTEYIIFNQAIDLKQTIWVGSRIGQENACKIYGADKAYESKDFDKHFLEILANKKNIYYSLGIKPEWDNRLMALLNQARKKYHKTKTVPNAIQALQPILHEMRLIKSPYEINVMRIAAQISAKAHLEVMKKCKVNKVEYELEAEFTYVCTMSGCRALAYTTIVGGGNNACTLHYIDNNQMLQEGSLVLIDAGGEFELYAADITRTIPVNGKFSVPQAALYELVLKAQMAAISIVQPGLPWTLLQEKIVFVLVEGLVALGILKGDIEKLIHEKAYQPFYMHSSGHWLGLDVHDVGAYQKDNQARLLEPGMVFTIEPGLYINANQENVDAKWRGIGIRIEDDILVTDTGYEILSKALPKNIKDKENIMQNA